MSTPPKEVNEDHLSWRFLKELESKDYRIFKASQHDVEHPFTQKSHQVIILDVPNWVNVIALTPEKEVVLVKQYRFGTREVTLEIPGGMIESGEPPLEAAKRELEEETGYITDNWIELGVVDPNPAFQTNACWTYLALDATPTGQLQPDSGEAIEVTRLPLADMPEIFRTGKIRHSLVIAAFFHFQQSPLWHEYFQK